MAKAKTGSKKTTAEKAAPKKTEAKPAKEKAPKAAKPAVAETPKAAKPAAAEAPKALKAGKPAPAEAPKPAKAGKEKPAKGAKSAEPSKPAAPATPARERQRPRATKLPPPGEPLTKREMEQLLTVGEGRGVTGEGSIKGRLSLKDGMPFLHVLGRDKRELEFLLQGPDQEVFPAYVDHKVSVSGLIKKTTTQSGTVDVRKYSAKRPDEAPPEVPAEQKLRYLSPGEVEQVSSAGMGAGIKGFATIRGSLEMTGEDFFLVVSNGGTRHQVSFLLQGKINKSFRKSVGQTVQVMGVTDKSSGWGGTVQVENIELRPQEFRSVSRDTLEVVKVVGEKNPGPFEVKLNHGLSVRLPERAGYTWAIEPTMAKRLSLREANYEPGDGSPSTREFFFTPRNPGTFEVEFFLAKAFTPANVAKSFKLQLVIKP
jgi:hypothetical protein